MKGMILSLLIRPDAFFGERLKEPEDLRIPAIIVGIGAVIAAIMAYLVSGLYAGLFTSAAGEGVASLMGGISAVTAFIGFLLMWWVVFSGIFYLLSMPMKGSGSFRRVLEYTAYGLVPVIIGSALSLILLIYYLPMVEVPTVTSVTDPAAVQELVTRILKDPAFLEYTRISAVISVLFLAWSANLWIFGMRHARALSLRNAAIVVLIPVAVFIAYTLHTAFAGAPLMGGP